MPAVLVEEIDTVADLVLALALGVIGFGYQTHEAQRQGAHHFDQGRVFDIPGIVAEREVGVSGGDVDAFVPGLGFAHGGADFEHAHDRQDCGHGGPEETLQVHSRSTG